MRVDPAFDAVSVILSIGSAPGQIEAVLMGLLFMLVLFAFMTTKIDGIASAITGHHSHSSGFGAMMGFAMGRQMGMAMRGIGKMNMPGPRPRGPGGVISQR